MLKTVVIYEARRYDSNWPPENLLAFRDWLDDRIKSVPPESRAAATIYIEAEDAATEIEINYPREETAAEKAEKKRTEKVHADKVIQREKDLYEKLKVKYGSNENSG